MISHNLEISFLGNLSNNTYQVIPQQGDCFWYLSAAIELYSILRGTGNGPVCHLAGSLNTGFQPADNVSLKLIASGYKTSEEITYDILGQYRIDLLDNTMGSETAGDSILNMGVGGI